MSAIGLVASGLIESPLQVAAQTAPPAPSVLTATVRWQVLRNTVVFGGRVSAGKTIDVTASAPFSTVIVTRLGVRAGQRVRPGRLLAEIDGRPIFALQGMLPAYRDLREGDSGPDVTQLQRALERLGYADFDAPGYFGESTELALALFYDHLGYAPPLDRTEPRTAGNQPASAEPRAAGDRPASAGIRSASDEAYLPMSEITFIPAPSALVASVNARVGAAVTAGPVLRLATGEPTVTGKLGRYQARLVRAGMAATISSASPRLSRYGVVTYVGPYPVQNGQIGRSGTGYPVVVTGLRPLPQRLIGARVRLRMLIAATSRPVLAVPLTAIAVAANGSARVTRLAGGGRKVWVKVMAGVSAGGLVAVRPAVPGALVPGDRVVIGPVR
jgi:peptidoglycan hydrolase-like protein with peptidoglycan-binding domain